MERRNAASERVEGFPSGWFVVEMACNVPPGSAKAMRYFDRELGFKQDAAIWEHKVYRERPLLCDGDGPIADLRRWYAQFFD